jgi:hypothetical protein
MDWLTQLAPTVASALLGPLGGVAVAGLGKLFGIDNATVDKVSSAISDGKLTPEQITGLKEMELKFQNDEAERGFKYKELEFKDSQSARDMQISTKSTTPTVMSYLITFGFFGILGYMMSAAYVSSEPLLVMLGSLGTAWVAVVNFWFGSSHGSQNKDVMVANALSTKS